MEPKILSKFNETPKTAFAWRAAWLGISTILVWPILFLSAEFLRPIIERVSDERTGSLFTFLLVIVLFVYSIIAFAYTIKALSRGETSWMVRLGSTITVLVCALWVFALSIELAEVITGYKIDLKPVYDILKNRFNQ